MKTFLAVATLFVIGTASFLSACSVKNEKKEESYSYEYKDSLCTTDKHTFSSKRAYCEALLDEALNNGCLSEHRQEVHQNNCVSSTASF